MGYTTHKNHKQLRAAITIIYDSIQDLTHRGFSQFMVDNFDLWIIVEGSSKNGGSTGWCNSIPTEPESTDGTLDFIEGLALWNDHVKIYSHGIHYASKDEQFNKGIEILKSFTSSCFLWQVDSDEHWTKEDLQEAEKLLAESNSNTAQFQFNHYVINGDVAVVATGDWGSSICARLWKWEGQRFISHEPSVMENQTAPILLPQKFEHYSYCFESKVKFKSLYYKDHQHVYRNWRRLGSFRYPCHISKLFGINNPVGRGNSYLHKTTLPCANVPNQKVEKEAGNNVC